MRIKEINLKAYGCFTEYVLTLGTGNLYLIYGDNEAGKSTALRSITDALYGFPNVTSESYIHSNQELRVGLVLDNGTESLEFLRRKGQKNTVLNVHDQPIDEDTLQRFLHDMDRNGFVEIFGLDHSRLRDGGQLILNSAGNAGEVILAASTGLTRLLDLTKSLGRRAQDLYKPTGSNPTINSAIARHKRAKQTLADASILGRHWDELQAKYDQQQRDVESIRAMVEECSKEKEKLERIRRCLPQLAKRKGYLAECEELGVIPLISEQVSKVKAQASEKLSAGRARLEQAKLELENLGKKRERIEVREDLLKIKDDVSDLHQRIGAYREYVAKLPSLKSQLQDVEQGIATAVRSLGQDKPVDVLVEVMPPRHKRAALKELAERYSSWQASLDGERKQLHKLRQQQVNMENELRVVGEVIDCTPLQIAFSAAQSQLEKENQLTQKRSELARCEAAIAQGIKALGLWEGSLEELENLPIPPAETVELFETKFINQDNELKTLQQTIAERKKETASIQSRLLELEITGDLPTEEDLLASRKHRDHGWMLIKRAWLKGSRDAEGEEEFVSSFALRLPLENAYESSVIAADDLSDRLRREAEKVGSKLSLVQQISAGEAKSQELAAKLVELGKMQEELKGEWASRWQESAIVPWRPKEMRGWLKRVEQIRAQGAELRKIAQEIDGDQAILGTVKVDLVKELNGVLEESVEGESLGKLVSLAAERISSIEARNDQIRSIKRDISKAELEEASASLELDSLQKDYANWQSEWKQAMDELHLSCDTRPKAAESYIEGLDELVRFEAKRQELNRELTRMTRFVSEFEQRCQRIMSSVQPSLFEQRPDTAVRTLHEMCEGARQAELAEQHLSAQIKDERDNLAQAQGSCNQAQAALEKLCKDFDCNDLDEFESLEQKFQRLQELRKEIAKLESNVLDSGGGLTLRELEAEAAECDPSELPGRIEELALRLVDLNQKRSEAEMAFGAVRAEYTNIKAGTSFASLEASEDVESTFAELQSSVVDFCRVKLAEQILKRAVDYHRDKHIRPIVNRASALFSQLTLGAYTSLIIGFDDKDNPILQGERAEGGLVKVEQMSDGTQDQLYLALRLGCIYKYLEDKVPIPFVVDDILIHFDDERARAALGVLRELSKHTQVLFFTHHHRLIELAKEFLVSQECTVHYLDRKST